MYKLRKIAWFIVIFFTFNACCKSVCDCGQPILEIRYTNPISDCTNDFYSALNVFSISDSGDTVNLSQTANDFQCVVYLPHSQGQTLFVSNDSLNISDTIRVNMISFENLDDRCCDCGPYISNIEVSINDTVYNSPSISRIY